MSRIRTIKPDFWTDEKIIALPYEARLLFIGMWNFADDDGRFPDEPERIRMQVLPNDPVDADALTDLLVAAELLERYLTADGDYVLQIPNFSKHQKISHKTPSRHSLENSRQLRIPTGVRRSVAEKYGCAPGQTSVPCQCYYCGVPGLIHWPKRSNGRPGFWVSFTGMELDHLEAESAGGETSSRNIVLACRACNRSKANRTLEQFVVLQKTTAILRKAPENPKNLQSSPEVSGTLRPEGKGREGNRIEGNPPTKPDGVSDSRALDPGPAGRVASRFLQMREQLWPQDPYPLASMAIEAEAEAWLADGMAAERIIATFATGMQQMVAQKRAAPNSLRAFGRSLTDVLADVKARGSGARANGHSSGNGAGSGGITLAEEREAESVKWRVKVQGYLDNGYWPGDGGSGPKPTKPDTQVPLEILAEFATKFSDAGMQVPALGRAPRAKL